MQIVVAGFHRSGTSLATQLLHRAGLFVGSDLLGAKPTNPYGHFEDRDFLRLHRNILERHGTDWQWDSVFPFFIGRDHWNRMRGLARQRDLKHEVWGFKDPRVCLFLGAWKHVMPDAKFVMIYRDPGECVRSLESRQAADYFRGEGNAEAHLRLFREPDHALRLWDAHNRAMVSFARGHVDDCLVIPYTDLVAGRPVVDEINQRFGSRLKPVTIDEVFDPAAAGSRHAPQRVALDETAVRIPRTWEALESLAARTES